MALSVVDLYAKILPRTNCRDCGYPTCLAFAGMVVSEKLPLKNCPHIAPELLEPAQAELNEQYKAGKWLKKDMAAEALGLAREKAAPMSLEEIAGCTGGVLADGRSPGPFQGEPHIKLPYFTSHLLATKERVTGPEGNELSRNEQTFVLIHMACGGTSLPTGRMKSFKEFPNTVSKQVSMKDHVEAPLKAAFTGKLPQLALACRELGGTDVGDRYESPDLAFQFHVFPKVYVTLLFWDGEEGFEADVTLLFDETILDHMDIEAVMFMSEALAGRLKEKA